MSLTSMNMVLNVVSVWHLCGQVHFWDFNSCMAISTKGFEYGWQNGEEKVKQSRVGEAEVVPKVSPKSRVIRHQLGATNHENMGFRFPSPNFSRHAPLRNPDGNLFMQLFPARSAITGRIGCYRRDATSAMLLCPACPSRRGGGVGFRLTVLGILRDTAATKVIEEQGYL
jgi:hypothetical protein